MCIHNNYVQYVTYNNVHMYLYIHSSYIRTYVRTYVCMLVMYVICTYYKCTIMQGVGHVAKCMLHVDGSTMLSIQGRISEGRGVASCRYSLET